VPNSSAVSYLETNSSFVGPSGQNGTGDYGFSQIVVVPAGNVVPVPEPRTAAAILCALFVAALVGRQLILRRQEDADADAGVALAA
jgi:NADPH:quinone reductase-like Zn-dependent oxidoreductase